jgi:hypothetical protein
MGGSRGPLARTIVLLDHGRIIEAGQARENPARLSRRAGLRVLSQNDLWFLV